MNKARNKHNNEQGTSMPNADFVHNVLGVLFKVSKQNLNQHGI